MECVLAFGDNPFLRLDVPVTKQFVIEREGSRFELAGLQKYFFEAS